MLAASLDDAGADPKVPAATKSQAMVKNRQSCKSAGNSQNPALPHSRRHDDAKPTYILDERE